VTSTFSFECLEVLCPLFYATETNKLLTSRMEKKL